MLLTTVRCETSFRLRYMFLLISLAKYSTSILYYSRDRSLDVSVERFNNPHGYGQEMYMMLEDEELIHLLPNSITLEYSGAGGEEEFRHIGCI
jgi:hypothetical protein